MVKNGKVAKTHWWECSPIALNLVILFWNFSDRRKVTSCDLLLYSILICFIDDNMVDPLSAKLGEFDINDSANMTTNENIDEQDELNNENLYVPALTKEVLELV